MAVSESRAASDTRHRVAYPNSRPRAIKLVGLGDGGRGIAEAVGSRGLRHVEAISLTRGQGAAADSADMLQAIADAGSELARAIDEADMVFVIARDGDSVALAPAIGQMAHRQGVLVTGILIQDRDRKASTPDATLDALRRASDMLVVVSDTEYVAEMLGALGA